MAWLSSRLSPEVITLSPTSERISSQASPLDSRSANVSARRITLDAIVFSDIWMSVRQIGHSLGESSLDLGGLLNQFPHSRLHDDVI
jgi:hypothetical protein